MLQKTISDIKHKVKKKVNSEGIIYIKSKRIIMRNDLEIWLIVCAIFILIINIFSEGLRKKTLYIITGVLCLISFMIRYFMKEKKSVLI